MTPSPLPTDMTALPANCRQVFSRAQIDAALDALAQTMTPALAGKQPLMLCVMQGGLIFAGQLIPRLRFDLDIDYIHATRYRNGLRGADIEWKAEPASSLAGRNVVILDDILDEGYTLKAISAYCRRQGAADVKSAVLLHKQHARGDKTVNADFVALEVEDRYVFGFGMDCEGRYRQLDAIYALEEA